MACEKLAHAVTRASSVDKYGIRRVSSIFIEIESITMLRAIHHKIMI